MPFGNPFGDTLSVKVKAQTSQFTSAMKGAMGTLGGFKGIVAGTAAGVGVLAGVMGAQGVQAAGNFEEAMTEVEKVTDPETAREMGDAIMDMASKMPTAHEELAGIASIAGRLGVRGSENIQQFTEVTAKMAEATDLGAEQAANAFARLTEILGEPITAVEGLGSSVNELSNNMATSSSEIVDSMMRASGAMEQLGVGTSDALALSAAINEVSESAERGGTRLRALAQSLMDPGKVKDIAGALGMTVDEFKNMRENDPTELIELMAGAMKEGGERADALRGVLRRTARTALAAFAQNLEGINEGQEIANEQMEDATSLQEEYETALDDLNKQMEIVGDQIHGMMIEIGEELMPVMKDFVDFIQDEFPEIKSVIVDTFGVITEGIKNTITVIEFLTGQDLPGLQEELSETEARAEGVINPVQALTTHLGDLRTGIQNLPSESFEDIAGLAHTALDNIDDLEIGVQDLVDIIDEIGEDGQASVGEFIRALEDAGVSLDDLGVKSEEISSDTYQDWQIASQNIIDDLSSVKSTGTDTFSVLKSKGEESAKYIEGKFEDMVVSIKNLLRGLGGVPLIPPFPEEEAEGIKLKFKDLLSDLKEMAEEKGQITLGLKASIETALGELKGFLTEELKKAMGGITGDRGIMASIKQTVLSGFKSILASLQSAIMPVIANFLIANPIIAAIAVAFGAVTAASKKFRKGLAKALGGIWKAVKPLVNALGNMLKVVGDFLAPVLELLGTIFEDLAGPIRIVTQMIGGTFNAAIQGVSTALDILKTPLKVLADIVSAVGNALKGLAKMIGDIIKIPGKIVKGIGGLAGDILGALNPLNWFQQGAIFRQPAIAGVGDVPEAVTPLSKLPGIIAKGFEKAQPTMGGGQPVHVHVHIGEREVADSLIKEIKTRQKRRTGKSTSLI